MTRLGIVTGLLSEAAIIRGYGSAKHELPLLATAAGHDAHHVTRAAQGLIEQGANALVSFGLAGGLAPEARAGNLVIAGRVCDGEGNIIEGDLAWASRAQATFARQFAAPVRNIVMASGNKPVASVVEKARLYGASAAYAVDMESLPVAQVAAEKNLPFIAVRAIVDDASSHLLPAALHAQNGDGSINYGRLFRCLAESPWDIFSLISLGLKGAKASATLRAAVGASGGRFFF